MSPIDDTCAIPPLAIVGPGRLGGLISRTLGLAEPFGRGFDGHAPDGRSYEAVLLCVPDQQIRVAAAAIRSDAIIGHCSGATGLDVLGLREGFSMHPLMTVTRSGADLRGAGAAVDGTSDAAVTYGSRLAERLGMSPFRVLPADRAAYHAAASVASNFLVTIVSAAEQLAASAGVQRRWLVPLVNATVENWAAFGAQDALTGPVARGDHETVERQRAAVSERDPQFLELFDALVAATSRMAKHSVGA